MKTFYRDKSGIIVAADENILIDVNSPFEMYKYYISLYSLPSRIKFEISYYNFKNWYVSVPLIEHFELMEKYNDILQT